MLDGILLVNKPAGITSHDAVNFIRERFGINKVGHGGTLDPLATGLLILMLGRATKLCQSIVGLDKEYIAQMTIGFATDTGDLAGEIIERAPDCAYNNITEQQIKEAVDLFRGETEQVPPMYSALKYKGKRLYKFARSGVVVPRDARRVKIHSLDIESINLPHITFKIKCSRGLYIRQLCVDMGLKLGYPAHLSEMKRTAIGIFSLDKSYTIDSILNDLKAESFIIPIEVARSIILK
ncbi:MAG: tRNA pseudouridine(55) synthase TruB [Candidatus Omnitrophica bacterium]|nr:tRNA pseudouridine(55) synthase TruB [Candidatus Omnitrophota bacterium]